jgi:hypothetical protein
MDAFNAIFADASKTRATISQKRADGTVRSAKLAVGPASMQPADFAEAAMRGTTFAEKVTEGETTRTRTRPDVTGAAARSAVTYMMGFIEAETDTVPAGVRNRGKAVLNSSGKDESAAK